SPNLPGPSLDLFSFFPDETETQEAPSNQKHPLKDRVCSFVDRVGYKVYSSFNRPLIRPKGFAEVVYQVKKRKFFSKKPQSYEEARAKVLNDPLKLYEWSWGHRLEKENLELYSDPEFRKERVKAYADSLFYGTAELPEDRKEEHWLIMTFCEEELHDLYRREPKYLRQSIPLDLRMIKAYNKPILAKHKKEWDQLLPSEKAEKIFGKRRKYEVTAGISIVTACFFLCQYLSLYQRLQSPQQPSTF
ncbi:MAG: hypothetical protein WBD50_03465, partial [Candidatus Rhabdochlamydia sp.]